MVRWRGDEEKERTPVHGADSNRAAGLLPDNDRPAFIEELELAREAFALAAQKLPIKTKFVSRADLEGGIV